jgi:hypothetical protein
MSLTPSRREVLAALAATALPLPALAAPRRFTFARVRYQSGDWEADSRMPANLLDSMAAYTRVPLDAREQVVALDSRELFAFPFVYLTGHGLVRFSKPEREAFGRYVSDGGFVLVDDCNHDVGGVFAQSFEAQVGELFPGRLRALPRSHPLYACAFQFPEGPPTTHHELNGFGDTLVHDALQAVEIRGRIGLLYSNKDYGCEWDHGLEHKQYGAQDSTRFGVNILTYALS